MLSPRAKLYASWYAIVSCSHTGTRYTPLDRRPVWPGCGGPAASRIRSVGSLLCLRGLRKEAHNCRAGAKDQIRKIYQFDMCEPLRGSRQRRGQRGRGLSPRRWRQQRRWWEEGSGCQLGRRESWIQWEQRRQCHCSGAGGRHQYQRECSW